MAAGRYLAVLLLAWLIMVSSIPHSSAEQTVSILVVASDFDDVLWARDLESALPDGWHVDIAYIYKDYPSAEDERSILSDLARLWDYEAVAIPDLNPDFAYGGRLTAEETETLLEYAHGGHVLLLGLNTIIQNWEKEVEEAAGVKIAGIASGDTRSGHYDILYHGKRYMYTEEYDAAKLDPVDSQVIAWFANGLPAATINQYGSGAILVLAYNPVAAVFYEPQTIEVPAEAIQAALATIQPQQPPASVRASETLHAIASAPLTLYKDLSETLGGGTLGMILATIILAFILWILLLLLSLTCILPQPLYKPVLKPLALTLRNLTDMERRTYAILRRLGPHTLNDITSASGLPSYKVCAALRLLEARGKIERVKVEKRALYATPDTVAFAFLENTLYEKLARTIVEEPGITITELAARLGIPLDTALKISKRLAGKGLAELRKAGLDYEVYPTPKLEEFTYTHDRRQNIA